MIVLFTARFGLNLQVARRWRLERYVPIIGGVVVTRIGAGSGRRRFQPDSSGKVSIVPLRDIIDLTN
ncbi:MAG: hypothetical protein ABR609_11420 [Acidimicrobiia bacterium]